MELIAWLIANPTPLCTASLTRHLVAARIFLSSRPAGRTVLHMTACIRPHLEHIIIALHALLPWMRYELALLTDVYLTLFALPSLPYA